MGIHDAEIRRLTDELGVALASWRNAKGRFIDVTAAYRADALMLSAAITALCALEVREQNTVGGVRRAVADDPRDLHPPVRQPTEGWAVGRATEQTGDDR